MCGPYDANVWNSMPLYVMGVSEIQLGCANESGIMVQG